MKTSFGVWLAVGVAIGGAAGVALENISSGVGFGAEAGILMALMQKRFSKK